MRELLLEIINSMRSNKLRTCLTGFAISWGIFMLIVLLGAGTGLKRGMIEGFSYMKENSLSISSGRTSKAFQTTRKNQLIEMSVQDSALFSKALYPKIEQAIPAFSFWGKPIVQGEVQVSGEIIAIEPRLLQVKPLELIQGRFINEIDLLEHRKCIVLNKEVVNILFPKQDQYLGKKVTIGKVIYSVVGVYSGEYNSQWSASYIPLSTGIKLYATHQNPDDFYLSLKNIKTENEAEELEELIRQKAARNYIFDPSDRRALRINNTIENYLTNLKLIGGIEIFVWIIALGTLVSGVVGVGNIMVISVKERTREFGIRMALGAKPRNILTLVLLEAILLTTLFGYIGIFTGVALTELISFALNQSAPDSFIKDLSVEMGTIIQATILLISAGLIAGYLPAKRAVSIKPIEAMRG